MAVVRLEFDLDSEVYPELHAVLAALGSAAARGERLRQLAATGLVWETVRIHGASVATLPAAAASAPSRPVKPARQDDFIDLALDAVPMAANASQAPPARTPERPFEGPARHIPVLLDVVSPAPAGAPPVSAMHRPTMPRSRLLRMKEKGLFRNG